MTPHRPGPLDDPRERRTVALVGEIDDETAQSVMAQLLVLEADDPASPVHLHIDSPGGSFSAGMAVYDTLRYVRCDVVTRCTGHAGGMAQVLLCAGTRGQRGIRRDGSVRMVPPSAPGPPTDELRRIVTMIVTMTAEHTGQPADRVRADVVAGRSFTAAEAVAYGLVDRIDDLVDDGPLDGPVRGPGAAEPGRSAGRAAEARVLHREVGVAVNGRTPRSMLDRGTELPASRRVVFHTARATRRGTDDPIATVTLVEDDGGGLGRAPVLGSVEIRADARRDVPAGSPLQVGVAVDRDRLARVEVYVPLLDEDEAVTVRLAPEPAPAPAEPSAPPRPPATPEPPVPSQPPATHRPATAGQPTAGMSTSDAVYERLLRQRIVVLGQAVDDEIANRVVAQMMLLAAEDPAADISLYVNSPGGSVTAGSAILDTMALVPCDVATWAMGMAAGMGQVLLSAGAAGKRIALPHSRIQLTWIEAAADGSTDGTLIARHRTEMAERIAGYTGQTAERILADQRAGRWFTAEEAVDYGLADHVQAGTGTG